MDNIPVQVSPEQGVSAPKYKVLLIEDDNFLSSLIKSRLQKNPDIEILHALDGEQAIELLKNSNPNLILLDLILPKKSGFEVMENIQSDPQLNKSPIIIISNLGQESDVQRGKELGAVEYFVKAQTSIDDLVRKIEEFLNRPAQS